MADLVGALPGRRQAGDALFDRASDATPQISCACSDHEHDHGDEQGEPSLGKERAAHDGQERYQGQPQDQRPTQSLRQQVDSPHQCSQDQAEEQKGDDPRDKPQAEGQ